MPLETRGKSEKSDTRWVRLAIGAFIAGNSMAASLAVNIVEMPHNERRLVWSALALGAALVAVLVGQPLFVAVQTSVIHRRLGMEALFVCALAGATGLSCCGVYTGLGPVYFEVIGLLLVIFAWGQQLKQSAQARVMASLAEQAPASVKCMRRDAASGHFVPCLKSELQVGDAIRLQAADSVPADGTILEGKAYINTAVMTGEGLCVSVACGDKLQAGMQVVDGPIVMRVEAAYLASQIDLMAHDILSGMHRRSAWEQMAERWARRLLPIVASVSLLTFAYWSYRQSLSLGLLNAMAVLLVACPCALSFATPTALWAGVIAMTRLGYYTRSTSAIERLAQVDTLVFDKTGTLTDIRPLVDTWVFADAYKQHAAQVRSYAASAQRLSQHPVAQAFRQDIHAATDAVAPLHSSIRPGAGICVRLQTSQAESQVCLGEASGLLDAAQMAAWSQLAAQLDPALRAVCVTIDDKLAAAAGVSDHVVLDVQSLCEETARLGLQSRVFSGDTQARVDLLQHASAQGRMSPAEKKSAVLALKREGRHVCFIGDGINDASAMSVSDVSMAIETGTPTATGAADFLLPQASVRNIGAAISATRDIQRVVRGNLYIAIAYNSVAMSVAATGFIHPVFAAVMMLGASLTVTLRVARYLA